jgi:hypothetical protein
VANHGLQTINALGAVPTGIQGDALLERVADGGCPGAPADAAALAAYREAGIQRVLLEVPDASRDEVLRVLDKNAALAAKLA